MESNICEPRPLYYLVFVFSVFGNRFIGHDPLRCSPNSDNSDQSSHPGDRVRYVPLRDWEGPYLDHPQLQRLPVSTQFYC